MRSTLATSLKITKYTRAVIPMEEVCTVKANISPLRVEAPFPPSSNVVNLKNTRVLHPTASEKKNGVVYTPEKLARYVAEKLVQYFCLENPNLELDASSLSVLDPACGDGELLNSCRSSLNAHGVRPESIFLNGVDIDAVAAAAAYNRLKRLSPTKIVNTNGLCPFDKTNQVGWQILREKLQFKRGFDFVIANPPWGADVGEYSELLASSNLELFERQHDSSDLFVESTIRQLKPAGLAAFIIPDSIFAQERANLRRILATTTTIKFIGRFGEKIFPTVNRACAVIIVQNTIPDTRSYTDCFRLNSNDRNLILSNQKTFDEIENKVSHEIEQRRFSFAPEYLFNIDLENSMELAFNKILSQPRSIKYFLSSSRGVELSKRGKILKCPKCEYWQPLPKNERCLCSLCGDHFNVENGISDTIITDRFSSGLKSLIVGTNINRYACSPNLWIDTARLGINYKSIETYTDEKIIVRKTGVGITATIDYTESLTNQVVYIFKKLNENYNNIPLEIFLMILSSRLAFFYIVMIGGENEWKTHPYLTQKRVLNIPVPCFDKANKDTIKEGILISKKIKKIVKSGKELPNSIDAKCEKFVADLYGLSEVDYGPIFKVINQSQELIPVKKLKRISISDVFGNNHGV
jgi:adenine-specific DNA-methyltransferase